ncbi:MAG TPA: hypothetical protein VMH85_01960 [Terriglobales bacterium]|nr:hypothetical protein [Terriglobales bacterium]
MTLPILVTGTEPNSGFSEMCETLVVSAHGCALHSSTRLEAGAPVYFQSKQGRRTEAHIVDCRPINSGRVGWQLAARLDRPGNFWGLESCPEDWMGKDWTGGSTSRGPREMQRQETAPADDQLQFMVAELVQPLHAELAQLREKLTHASPKRSEFEISLSHIPPEVEEKLWLRLREDLGAQVLQQTREQSAELLQAADESIARKIREGEGEFRGHLAQEVQAVGQRARDLSDEIADTVQQHVHAGAERFQQQALEAGIRLERRTEEFLRTLQQRLSDEHETYRREMQQVQAALTLESSRLQAQTTDLAVRIAKLDESARQLESDLDARLVRMGSDIISGARTQLENALDVVLKELGTRNARELGIQLEESRAQLKSVQKGIETSVSELVKSEVAGNLLSFGQTMEELARDSVGRWRQGLAQDLNSVAKILGGELRGESVFERNNGHAPPTD